MNTYKKYSIKEIDSMAMDDMLPRTRKGKKDFKKILKRVYKNKMTKELEKELKRG